MIKKEKIKIIIDLLLIFLVTMAALLPIMILGQRSIMVVVENSPILIKTIFVALIQFSIAGLGVVVVMLIRKEKFSEYGLRRKGIIRSLIAGAVLVLVFIGYTYIKEGNITYMPFRQVYLTKDLMKSGFPVSFIGMIIVASAWGFFEGFNYVFISRKINGLIKINNPFLRLGPIIMGISGILVHGAVGQGMLSILGSFFIVYFMLLIHELTDNSWGCILIFFLFWNAI
jgi:hypothetical protein